MSTSITTSTETPTPKSIDNSTKTIDLKLQGWEEENDQRVVSYGSEIILMPREARRLLTNKLMNSSDIRSLLIEGQRIFSLEDAFKLVPEKKTPLGRIAQLTLNHDKPQKERITSQTEAVRLLQIHRGLLPLVEFPKMNTRKRKSAGAPLDLLVEMVWCLLVPYKTTRTRIIFNWAIANVLLTTF